MITPQRAIYNPPRCDMSHCYISRVRLHIKSVDVQMICLLLALSTVLLIIATQCDILYMGLPPWRFNLLRRFCVVRTQLEANADVS